MNNNKVLFQSDSFRDMDAPKTFYPTRAYLRIYVSPYQLCDMTTVLLTLIKMHIFQVVLYLFQRQTSIIL